MGDCKNCHDCKCGKKEEAERKYRAALARLCAGTVDEQGDLMARHVAAIINRGRRMESRVLSAIRRAATN